MGLSVAISNRIEKLNSELETRKIQREFVANMLQNRSSSEEDDDVVE